jgi:outer membrane lipoprotein
MVLFLGACSNVPVAIQQAPQPDLQLKQLNADAASHQGQKVRWGGQLVKVENDNDGSTIHIAQFPLNSYGRPIVDNRDDGDGRFIVKTQQFIDPAIYKQGTLVTVAGTLAENETVTIDKKTMSLPVIALTDIYRWANYNYNRDPWYGPGYYNGFYSPYYPGWRSSWRYYNGFYW